MSDDAFDTLMTSVDPPLVVVTTEVDGERAGCLVGFHSQSSIDSGHYSVWLSKANHTYRAALRATHLAVHFLTDRDLALAERFGTQCGAETDKFAGLAIDSDEHGSPLLRECPNRLVLERTAVLDDGGDHVCLTTRVLSAHTGGTFTPLRVSDASHLDPGHPAEARAIHP
ncbi:flavin reductase [Aeromicrobium sp.]|uniref:flavin reductase family protein n=1 Tax=Aeromicrobium sp. TaxID=1871063 RepID=UPI0028B12972|nr:flavin reductase [Aeromicrobium sp.]